MIRVPQVRLAAPNRASETAPFAQVNRGPVEDFGRPLQQMAGVLQNTGLRLAAMGEKAVHYANAARAKQNVGRLREQLDNLLEGEDGFLHKLGDDAIDARVTTLQAIDKIVSSYEDEGVFDNDTQREMFTQASAASVARAQIATQSWGEKQARVAYAATSKAAYTEATNQLAKFGWSKDSEAVLRAEVDAYRGATGMPKAAADLLVKQQLSSGVATYIQGLINADDIEGAQQSLDTAYDPADGDGNKRDKLVGSARAGLTSALASRSESLRKQRDVLDKTAARDLDKQFGVDLADQIFRTVSETTPSLAARVSLSKQQIAEQYSSGKLSRERTVAALTQIDLLNSTQAIADSELALEYRSEYRDHLAGVDLSEIAETDEAFKAANPDAWSYLSSSQGGRDYMDQLRITHATNLVGAAKEAQKKLQAGFNNEALFWADEELTPDAVFTEKYPNTKAGWLQLTQDIGVVSSVTTQSSLVARYRKVHGTPDPNDELMAAIPNQVSEELRLREYNELFSATDAGNRGPVHSAVLDSINKAWGEHVKGGGATEGNKAQFHEWLSGVLTGSPDDTFTAGDGNAQYSRSFLSILNKDAKSLVMQGQGELSRETSSGTYILGSSDRKTVGGVMTNVFDYIARMTRGIPLPHKRKSGAMLSPDVTRMAERLYVGLREELGRAPTITDFQEREGEMREALNLVRNPPMDYARAAQRVDPATKEVYEETVDYFGMQERSRDELVEKLRNRAAQEVFQNMIMDLPEGVELHPDDQVRAIDDLTSRYLSGLPLLENSISQWARWKDMLRREKEGAFGLGVVPAPGTTMYGWSHRVDSGRPFFGFDILSYTHFKQLPAPK